jgi:hypothetical protein
VARRGGGGIGFIELLIGLLAWAALTGSVTHPLAQWLGMSQEGEDRLFSVAFFGVPGLLIILWIWGLYSLTYIGGA